MADRILSELEERFISLTGELAELGRLICYEPSEQCLLGVKERRLRNRYLEVAADDYNELVAHIHVIQKAILGQAAARHSPDKFRLLGAECGWRPPE